VGWAARQVCRVVGTAAALGDRFLGLACVLLLRHADAASLPPVSPRPPPRARRAAPATHAGALPVESADARRAADPGAARARPTGCVGLRAGGRGRPGGASRRGRRGSRRPWTSTAATPPSPAASACFPSRRTPSRNSAAGLQRPVGAGPLRQDLHRWPDWPVSWSRPAQVPSVLLVVAGSGGQSGPSEAVRQAPLPCGSHRGAGVVES
jgi:hypothetical protein